MKVFNIGFVGTCLVLVASGAVALSLNTMDKGTTHALKKPRTSDDVLIHNNQKSIRSAPTLQKSIFPPEIDLKDGNITLNLDIGGLNISIDLNVCSAKLVGADSIQIDIITETSPTIIPITVNINSEVLLFKGKHDLDIVATTAENGQLLNLTSIGGFDVEIFEGFLSFETIVIVAPATGNLTFTEVKVDLGFTCVAINTDGGFLNGEEINWIELSNLLTSLFSTVWKGIQPKVDEEVTKLVNNVFRECTASHLAQNNFTCIRFDELPFPIPGLPLPFNSEFEQEWFKFSLQSTCPKPSIQSNFLFSSTNKRAVCDKTNEEDWPDNSTPKATAITFKISAILFILTILFNSLI